MLGVGETARLTPTFPTIFLTRSAAATRRRCRQPTQTPTATVPKGTVGGRALPNCNAV